MDDLKGLKTQIRDSGSAESQSVDGLIAEKRGTPEDQKDMHRMGKMQEMRRNFKFVSIFGYAMILMATWEVSLTTLGVPLLNGGTGGAIFVYIATVLGMGIVTLSMAEMASMAPTSGGQYHWVSEFAPRKHQRFLSYLVGWLCVLGWQTGVPGVGYLAGTQIQGLIILNNPSYIPQRWHGSLIVIAIASLAIIFNTVLARKLPLVEGTVLILHICGFFAILIVMWVLAPRSKASDVFGSFQDNAGWGNVGLSCLVGQLAPIFGLLGSDSATHMSEELRNASWVLPRAMVWSVSINAVLGLIMLISVCFCLGEVPTILASPTGYPYIQVLYNATGSTAATSVLVSIAIIMNSMGCVNNVATSSRQLFAFARDHGLPFGEFLSYVRPGWDIPLNAVLLTFVIAVLMSLINIGSTVAFNSIASLGTGALLSSYIISCSCMFLKRWRNEPLLPSRFNLGKYGLAINGISVAYLSIAFVFTFFPAFPHPSADLMNWSILMYGSTATLCLCYFFYKGRHAYVGPVEYLNKDA